MSKKPVVRFSAGGAEENGGRFEIRPETPYAPKDPEGGNEL